MRDYAVVASIKAEQKGLIDHVFDKGYEQGYQDGKLDGEAEKIEKLEKQFDDEKKAEYKRGYEQGRRSTITIKDFEEYYHIGLKHGQELRAKEAERAEACGMKRAWKAVRKIIDMPLADLDELYPGWDVEHILEKLSAKEVIEKIEAWEKEQEENEKVDCNNTNCKNCINHNACDYEDEWKLRRRGIVPAPPKEKHSEKSCENCKWMELDCNNPAICKDMALYEPKQDAPETNVENRVKIVKAIAGLLAAYGEQLWDVVADFQKNP